MWPEICTADGHVRRFRYFVRSCIFSCIRRKFVSLELPWRLKFWSGDYETFVIFILPSILWRHQNVVVKVLVLLFYKFNIVIRHVFHYLHHVHKKYFLTFPTRFNSPKELYQEFLFVLRTYLYNVFWVTLSQLWTNSLQVSHLHRNVFLFSHMRSFSLFFTSTSYQENNLCLQSDLTFASIPR